MKKFDWWALLVLVVLGLVGVKALFHPGFYTSHDGEHQVIRLMHLVKGLKDGQLPVRWAGPPAFDGYGYPLFIFTYRLPFYFGAFFNWLGFSLTDSVKAVFVLTYILSGVFMYWAQKKVWGNNLAALIGAIFYLWVPWRFSVIFVKASLGEAVCCLFFPLIIWALATRKPFLGGFSLACLFLSHAILALLFLPFLLVLMLFFLSQSKDKKKLFGQYVILFLIAAGLAAFYWLPAMIEKKETMFSQILVNFYRDHFPSLRQLLYSPWGYGFSWPGTERDAMSFQAGIAQWLTVFLAASSLIWLHWQKKKWSPEAGLVACFIVLFLLAVFFMLPVSDFYWQFISAFLGLDYPFRHLAFTSLLAAFIVGGLVVLLKNSKTLLYPVILGLLFLTFYGNRNHLRVNLYRDLTDDYFLDHPATSNSYNEYRPRWAIAGQYEGPRKAALEVINGEAEILNEEIRSHWQKFSIQVIEAGDVVINTVYYPGWRLWVDGQERKTEPTKIFGMMRFPLEAGEHKLFLKFTRTGDRLLGEAISLLSLSLIVFYLLRKRNWNL